MPIFNTTFTSTISNFSFGNLPQNILIELFKDGRIFSHFMERILAQEYGLIHIPKCKGYDLIDPVDSTIKYEQKTFTENGCKFMPSNMVGQGRQFDQAVFEEKSRGLNYVIVSNLNFPEIKVKFVKGVELAALYPGGEIKRKDHGAFFS